MNNEAKKGRPFLSFLLVAVMIAELATAAFKYPGFLVKTPGETNPYRPTGPTQGNEVSGSTQANTETPGEEDEWAFVTDLGDWTERAQLSLDDRRRLVNEYGLEITQDSSPDNPALIEVAVTPEMLSAAAPVSLPVTPENPAVTWNGVTVDFGKWNITEPDTLVIRDLGSAGSSATASTLRMLDFSLASGRHEFATNVTITVPCAMPENDSCIVTFNEETGRWEPLPFRFSSDGGTVTYTKTHFSTDAQMIFDRVKWLGEKDIIITRPQNVELADYAYYPLLAPAELDQRNLREYLEADDELAEKVITADGLKPDTFKDYGYEALSAFFGRTDANIGTINLMTSDSIPGALASAVTFVGIALTVGKVAWQVNHNKDKYAVLQKNKYDLIGAGAGAVALATPGNPVTAAIAIAAFYLPEIVDTIEESDFIRDYDYLLYRNYLDEGVPVTVGEKTFRLYPDGRGWDRAMTAVRLSVVRAGKNPGAIAFSFDYLYDQYLNSFFRLTKEEKLQYAKEYDSVRYFEYRNPETGELETIDLYLGLQDESFHTEEELRRKWAAYQLERVKKATEELLADQVRILLDECEMAIVRECQNVLLPYLNRTIEILAKDLAMTKEYSMQRGDDSFYGSTYSVGARLDNPRKHQSGHSTTIVYGNRTKMLFQLGVGNQWLLEPRPDSPGIASAFRLYATPNSNTLTKMRYYAYMMIGCPTSVIFHWPGTEKMPKKTVPFRVPDTDNSYIPVTLLLNAEGREYTYYSDDFEESHLLSDDMLIFIINTMRSGSVYKGDDGSFVFTAEKQITKKYSKAEIAAIYGLEPDDPDWQTIFLEFVPDPFPLTGNTGEQGVEATVELGAARMVGDAEVWRHYEYDDPEEDPPVTFGIDAHFIISATGTGTARTYLTEVKGKKGKYEVIELSMEIHYMGEGSYKVIYNDSGEKIELEPAFDPDSETFVFSYISKEPVPGK